MKDLEAVDILLVEDNSNDSELTLKVMSKYNISNKIDVVKNGKEALDYIFCRNFYAKREISNRPKIILLDLKLPKISGFKVLEAIKSDNRTNMIPVIVLTSSHETPDIKKAYDLGANSYVVKPVSFEAFMDAISHLGFYWLLVNQVPR